MAFAERQLQFTFSGAKSGSFSASGLRAAVSIQSFPGRMGSTAQVKIWGLSQQQMTAYSGPAPAAIAAQNFNLIIEAGDVGSTLSTVMNGPILSSFIDLSGAPESAFYVSAINVYAATSMIAAQSQPGPQNAEDLIASLCSGATPQLGFNNNGAHAVLRNQQTYGSGIEQIETIVRAAKFNLYFDGASVWIWPRGGVRGSNVINIGPNTAAEMVGYPEFWDMGIVVRTLYNPQLQIGYQAKVTSSIVTAQGTWDIIGVEHDLTTMLQDGPWFSVARLAWPQT